MNLLSNTRILPFGININVQITFQFAKKWIVLIKTGSTHLFFGYPCFDHNSLCRYFPQGSVDRCQLYSATRKRIELKVTFIQKLHPALFHEQ